MQVQEQCCIWEWNLFGNNARSLQGEGPASSQNVHCFWSRLTAGLQILADQTSPASLNTGPEQKVVHGVSSLDRYIANWLPFLPGQWMIRAPIHILQTSFWQVPNQAFAPVNIALIHGKALSTGENWLGTVSVAPEHRHTPPRFNEFFPGRNPAHGAPHTVHKPGQLIPGNDNHSGLHLRQH